MSFALCAKKKLKLIPMSNVSMKVYADTSVFGGVFDEEFAEPSKEFFDEIKSGKFSLVVSALVQAEIASASDECRTSSDASRKQRKLPIHR